MDPIEQLRIRLKQLNDEAQALIKAADTEKRELSDEEQTKFEQLTADFEKTKQDLDRRERLAQQANDLSGSNGRQTQADEPRPRVTVKGDRAERDGMAGFRDAGEFAMTVKEASLPGGRVDKRLDALREGPQIQGAPTNYHKEGGTGSGEGYMVPPSIREQIWENVFSDEDLLGVVNNEPTDRNAVELIADESTPWGATGIVARWRAEGTKMEPSKIASKAVSVRLNELYAFVLATDELLEDAPRLADRVTRSAAAAIRWKASNAVVYGDGVGQPLGWMNSGALVSVAKESAQAADTLVPANIAKMFSRLLPDGMSRAFWLANSDVIPQLMTMTLGNQLIWTPPNSGFAGAPGGFLFGRPIRLSEHAKTLGDKGDIQLIDPQGYYAVTKSGGVRQDQSIHLFFDYGITAFRWTFRMGGTPFLTAPVSPNNGATTKSHFVTLDERA